MSDRFNPSLAAEQSNETQPNEVYEAPVLIGLGNARALLAGTDGSLPDSGPDPDGDRPRQTQGM
jgi:hypothetical protein